MKLEKARKMVRNSLDIEGLEMAAYMEHVPYCEVCKSLGATVIVPGNYHPHRIKSGGSGGKYVWGNMIRLCHNMHMEVHRIGNKEFAIKYHVEKIRDSLKSRGMWTEQDEERYKDGN